MADIEYTNDENLTVASENDIFEIVYDKDARYLQDLDVFIKFIKACEQEVRKHPDYSLFVDTIRETCMSQCQILGNITSSDAVIEAHHGPLFTLFDYCVIITNFLLKKEGKVTTFRVAKLVLDEHFDGNVQIVMLSKTPHQLIDTGEIFINLNQGIGKVVNFIKKYKEGLDETYIKKINAYIRMSEQHESSDNGLLELDGKTVNWSYR